MRGWKRRSADRPGELAQAALELCAERGVQATRVADVAARAGVTVGTVYRYFRDKDELIAAALSAPPRPAPRAPTAARPGAAMPQLADALRRWHAFFRGHGAQAVRVALSDPQRHPVATMGGLGDATSELTSVLADGVARGDFRKDLEPGVVARALVAALAANAVIDGATGDDDELIVEALVAVATRGLRADGPSWRA